MARKKSVSYSQFALWEQCPYSWKLQYVDKAIPWSDNIHTLFGTAMHEVLQEYIRVMYTKSIVEADKLLLEEELEDRMKKLFMEIMQRNGGEQFCTKDEMTEFYNDGLKIIDFFKKKRGMYFSKKGYELLGPARACTYTVPCVLYDVTLHFYYTPTTYLLSPSVLHVYVGVESQGVS